MKGVTAAAEEMEGGTAREVASLVFSRERAF